MGSFPAQPGGEEGGGLVLHGRRKHMGFVPKGAGVPAGQMEGEVLVRVPHPLLGKEAVPKRVLHQ